MTLLWRISAAAAMIALTGLCTGGCGYSKSTSSSSSSGLSSSASIKDDGVRMAGYWTVTLENCRPTGGRSGGAVLVEQDGDNITFVFERGIEVIRLEGKLDGRKFRVSGTVMRADLETEETYEGTISDDGTGATGTASDRDTRTGDVVRCELRMARGQE